MKNFDNSPFLGEFFRALHADIEHADFGSPYACRPVAASTGGTALGRYKGRISLSDLAEFQSSLDAMVTENMRKVILDLDRVILSRSAIGGLVEFAATMHGRNKRLYLYRPSEQIRSSLAELGLTNFFSYIENEDGILTTLVV